MNLNQEACHPFVETLQVLLPTPTQETETNWPPQAQKKLLVKKNIDLKAVFVCKGYDIFITWDTIVF